MECLLFCHTLVRDWMNVGLTDNMCLTLKMGF